MRHQGSDSPHDTVHRGGALVSDYGFDDNGNRTSHRIGPASPLRGQSWPCLGTLPAGGDVTVSGSYDAQDRMSAYGTCTYEYTRNGELSRRVDSASNSTTEYEYDEFGNLRRVVLPDTRVITYHIDGLNRRVGKSINGVRQWGLLYANQLEPVAELDAAGNVVASFIYADRPHVPSLMLKGGQTYRIVADHLGSVRLVVNIATGAIAQRMTYDEYGNVVEDTNPGFQPFGYAGGIYDRDTGLVRFGARDYDAVVGRWTAKDPIGFSGGQNLYGYVEQDPINAIDIEGELPILLAAGVGYARCVASCAAINLLIDRIKNDCPEANVGDTVGDCAGECLNPLNWLKFGKSDDLRKMADKTRRKPGRHGEFKGNDSKVRENAQAREAGQQGGLQRGTDTWKKYHNYISGEGITDFNELREIAKDFASGRLR